ncbi:MAG: alpha/beta hydrolase [Thiohalomonadaceae bacterium]
MNLPDTLALGLKLGLGLAALHFAVLPVLVRLAWRAPRVHERTTPADRGLPFATVHVPTVRGKRLHGWFLPQGSPAPALVLMHGWGGNAEHLLPLADVLYRAGWTVLLVDARNHGLSDGDGISSMVKFAEDIDHALGWLRKRPEADARRLALVGHSVGAVAALLAASRRRDLAAVVSLAAFAHPREIMLAMMQASRVPYVPLGWWVLRHIEHAIGARYDAIAPVTTIAGIVCPVLLVHGMRDQRVPVADVHAIHAARGNTPAQLLLIPGSDHRLATLGRHRAALLAFLREAFASAGLVEDHEGEQGGAEGERKHGPERHAGHQQA